MSGVHTSFVQVAKEHDIDLLEAILMAKENNELIAYNGMIGEIEGPEEDDLFIFRCIDASFEDLVPAVALDLVS